MDGFRLCCDSSSSKPLYKENPITRITFSIVCYVLSDSRMIQIITGSVLPHFFRYRSPGGGDFIVVAAGAQNISPGLQSVSRTGRANI